MLFFLWSITNWFKFNFLLEIALRIPPPPEMSTGSKVIQQGKYFTSVGGYVDMQGSAPRRIPEVLLFLMQKGPLPCSVWSELGLSILTQLASLKWQRWWAEKDFHHLVQSWAYILISERFLTLILLITSSS